jgi:peptidyl-prolyl cis-trans isomerase D
MLAKLRQNSRSVIIWVLFGIIIAFFVISFGPQAGQDQFSCSGRSTYIAKVNDREISENSWRFAMNGLGFGGGGGERARAARARETVMDELIDRELFAQLAESMGFRVTDSLVEQRIAEGKIFLLGQRVRGEQVYFDENGGFDYDRLRMWSVGSLGLRNVREFADEQKRELLADIGRQQLLRASRVSPAEVLARYRQQNTTVTFDFIRWDPQSYERGLELSPKQVEAYLAAHEQEVKDKYTADERTYKNVSLQVKARHMYFERENPVAAQLDDEIDGDPETPAAPDPTLDPGHARATGARARVTGGESFASVAKELSEDPRTKAKGGALGWRSITSIVGGPDVSAAAVDLPDNTVSEIITTPRGFYLLWIEARREGDLAFDDVKYELAETLALEHYGREGARQDAEAALAKARASDAPLTELFPKPDAGDDGADEDGGDALPKTGRIRWESENIPAQFPPETQPKPAKPAAAATAGKGKGGPRALPAEIPRPADLPPAAAQSSGAVTRSGAVLAGPGMTPYIGRSEELVAVLFDHMKAGDLGDKVYEVDGAFVIVKMTDRSDADLEAFEKQRDTIYESYLREKNQRILDDWVFERCQDVASAGEITVNSAYVSYSNPDGDPIPSTYKPCSGGMPAIPEM